jgi:flagella basal body P-ring formation protein FlgA
MNARGLRLVAFLLGALPCLAVPASAQETVVVANRVIYPGEIVTMAALDEVPLRRQLPNPSAVVFDAMEIEGKVARRTLLPGRLIAVNSVREAYLVEPGTPVRVEFVGDGMVISISGVPLEAGAAGDVVRIRNVDSGALLNGVVMADGTVRVSAS